MRVYQDKLFQQHDTGTHPESAVRLQAISDQLAADTQLQELIDLHPAAESIDVTSVHASDQVDRVRNAVARGEASLPTEVVLSPATFDVAGRAAGTAVAAVDAIADGATNQALCLLRPPGHHATDRESMGFCVFNNVALAAKHARTKHGMGRILIIDWDVHHGNGTQDIFYRDGDVHFFSMHRSYFYPGSGHADEQGEGPGRGATWNLPMDYGRTRSDMQAAFEKLLTEAAAACKPELILISAGFDAHRDDPIGDLGLTEEDFYSFSRRTMDVAKQYCDGRVVSCLEGGYNPNALAASVRAHILGLLEQDYT